MSIQYSAASSQSTVDNDSKSNSFFSFFNKLEKVSGTVRLFERNNGEYYTLHGDDALYVADTIYNTRTALKYLGSDNIPSCTISNQNFENLLRDLLLTKKYRVEIWTSAKNSSQWEISRRASPGNLQEVEDLLFASTDISTCPVVISVKVGIKNGQKFVGAAFADATLRELGVCEFVDTDVYSNFESLLVQLSAKECVLPLDGAGKDFELNKIKNILKKYDIVITERKKADFSLVNIEQDLGRLLGDDVSVVTLPEYEMKLSLACLSNLITYLSLLKDESNYGCYNISTHDLTQYMKLDYSGVKALDLMPGPNDGRDSFNSLFGLLNKCKTSQGSRLLGQWIKQPLVSHEKIAQRLEIVEGFASNTEFRQCLRDDILKTFPDFQRLSKKFMKGSANLQDVVRIYQTIVKMPTLVEIIEEHGNNVLKEIYLGNLRDYVGNLMKLKEMVETTIDLDRVDNNEYIIKPEFDESLRVLKEKMDEILKEIDPEQESVAELLGLELGKKLKLEKNNIYGYHFRVTRNDAGCIRNSKKKFIELSCQRSGLLFTTPKLKDLNTQYSEISSEYDKSQSTLVREILNIVSSYCTLLEDLNTLIAHLDVLVGFAHVAVHAPIPYIRPDVMEKGSGSIFLKDARHPCLEMQDSVSFIPNDIIMKKEESNFLIITGPNMGGKSTFIRQIGVIALMAQIGSFVPCSEAKLPVFDAILARVGAGDSQMKGVSTFMAEMLETSFILKTATANSLIIIDELGRGTSTYDGFGLAWAISEFIAKEIKCFSLFATHFHELTALSETFQSVKNYHVTAHISEGDGEYGKGSITLLYKVQEGICDQSFGIHVAELANFPQEVVNLAKRKAAELEDFSNDSNVSGNEPKLKAVKTDEEEGHLIINNYLTEVMNLQQKQYSINEFEEKIVALTQRFSPEFENNSYITDIIESL